MAQTPQKLSENCYFRLCRCVISVQMWECEPIMAPWYIFIFIFGFESFPLSTDRCANRKFITSESEKIKRSLVLQQPDLHHWFSKNNVQNSTKEKGESSINNRINPLLQTVLSAQFNLFPFQLKSFSLKKNQHLSSKIQTELILMCIFHLKLEFRSKWNLDICC